MESFWAQNRRSSSLEKVKEVYGADSPRISGVYRRDEGLQGWKVTLDDPPFWLNLRPRRSLYSAKVRETIKRVIALFQGHPELIEGYAAFLPPGNTIQSRQIHRGTFS
jgi:hypothetical protein